MQIPLVCQAWMVGAVIDASARVTTRVEIDAHAGSHGGVRRLGVLGPTGRLGS